MTAAARRVLMIAFGYPPIGGAGMIRPMKFAKFLPEFGFLPTIVTPREGIGRLPCPREMGELPGVTVCRTEYHDVVASLKRRLGLARQNAGAARRASAMRPDPRAEGAHAGRWRRAIYSAITMPDEHAGWRRFAVAAGRRLLARDRYDVIFSTSPPETAHLVARRLKRDFGLPWVADLRDLWSGDHYRRRGAVKRSALAVLERRVLGDADAIVTVSERWRADLDRVHGGNGRRVVCIPHGFDADDYPVSAPRAHDRFTISYLGSLDRDFQDPTPLLEVLAQMIRAGQMRRTRVRVDFHVFGDNLPDFDRLAARFDLFGVLARREPLDYLQSLARQQASDVLLVLQWRSEAGKGNPPLKVYDYLGARRPILVVGNGEEVLGPLMRETGAGLVCSSPQAIRAALGEWYAEFIRTGTVKSTGSDEKRATYARRTQTARLADLFTAVGATSSDSPSRSS